jgi:hypothetical protein|tara:strand:+ start:311 stop:1027 length:717 start_codon:yes stop_codon:yes gene_type:complete
MSGIARIQARIEERNTLAQSNLDSKEFWIRDGDQIFFSSVGDGKEGDPYVSEITLVTYRDGNRWTNVYLKDKSTFEEVARALNIPEDTRPSNRFALWAYVYDALHVEKKSDDWEAIEGPNGKTLYKQEVNDYKIIALPFGRGGYLWSQLVDIFEDWGTLNKGVIRVKRHGKGLDTTYSLAATSRTKKEGDMDTSDLVSIEDYYSNRYGPDKQLNPQVFGNSKDQTTPKKSDENLDLFE